MVALPPPAIMSRRQNSSCDQCRKGKRACDAVWLRDRQLQRALDASGLKGGSAALSSHEGRSAPAILLPRPDDEASGSATGLVAVVDGSGDELLVAVEEQEEEEEEEGPGVY